MPYKNPNKRREYQRRWYQRRKAGLTTKLTTSLTDEERKEHTRISVKKTRQKKIRMIEKTYGNKCFFCPRTIVRIIHRKDGKKHKLFCAMGFIELKNQLNNHKDEYVRVCGICHRGIHWIMKYFGWTWKKIISSLI